METLTATADDNFSNNNNCIKNEDLQLIIPYSQKPTTYIGQNTL